MQQVIVEAPLTVWPSDLPRGVSFKLVREKESDVIKFKYKDTIATVGCGYNRFGKKLWATIYDTKSVTCDLDSEQAVFLIKALKNHYKKHSYDFAYSFADTVRMRGVLYKAGVKQRETGTGEIFIIRKVAA